ncbi:MAG: hypothetical protein QM788_02900 [Roseateles sp.]|uniref:hypothetical protein n=1 Tax=Roseateles sp. TaxID=1971397 RepID=UPI0039EB07D2
MSLRRAHAADAARFAALAQWVWLDSDATDGVEGRFLPCLAECCTPQQAFFMLDGQAHRNLVFAWPTA